LIECYLTGKEPEGLSYYSEEAREIATKCFWGFKEWWEDADYIVEASELQLSSEEYQYGGTIDVVFKRGNKYYIGDFKTSSAVRASHIRQLAAYKQLYEENSGHKVSGAVVIRLDKKGNGEAEVHWYKKLDKYFHTFLAALEVFKALKDE
jgi:predicted RecB family nuclease